MGSIDIKPLYTILSSAAVNISNFNNTNSWNAENQTWGSWVRSKNTIHRAMRLPSNFFGRTFLCCQIKKSWFYGKAEQWKFSMGTARTGNGIDRPAPARTRAEINNDPLKETSNLICFAPGLINWDSFFADWWTFLIWFGKSKTMKSILEFQIGFIFDNNFVKIF